MIYQNKKTKTISFPLGGIGTGSIGLAGNGELRDFEIFNRPNKNTRNGYSHFAIKATYGGKSVVKVLHGDTSENLMGGCYQGRGNGGFDCGPSPDSLAGFPHFKNVVFDGLFPMAKLTFRDDDFPATVRLTAFNPFIPHDEFHSSLPAAFFEWEIENTADEPIEFGLAFTLHNPAPAGMNRVCSRDGMTGVYFQSADKTTDEIDYSDLCILTEHADTCAQAFWYRGMWKDNCTTYWKNFLSQKRLASRDYDESGRRDHGTLASYVTVAPKKRERIRFILAWNVPNAYNYWSDLDPMPTWRNYYATQFEDSFASATYALTHFDELLQKTKDFTDALASCTLPEAVKDAISANLSVLKTPTALRLEDGAFWGWEGGGATVGLCHGTCQHVWNYAYVLPYLFPRLERSIRETTVKYALLDSGATTFRVDLPRKKVTEVERSCVDGQMGEVIKWYREWKFSGDTDWLRKHAKEVFLMLDYAFSEENPDRWDANQDGILEGRQHHTLDLELFGPHSWLQGLYLLALDCGAKMAEALGDRERVELYTRLYENGKVFMNERLFNGSYFCQQVDLTDKRVVDAFGAADTYWNKDAGQIKYQIGEGCNIDQMLADWHAALIGVNGVFDPEKKKIALQSLYQNNFKESMRGVTNMWRNFAVNDEGGTVICSYPEGVTIPAIPISYCEETMTGFEYALAGLMITEGFVSEGETMIRAIRDRYDGEKRNPWNEIECGNNYARSMASFALLPIYCGFTFDMVEKRIGFAPVGAEDGQYLWSVGNTWGTVKSQAASHTVSVLGEPLTLRAYGAGLGRRIVAVIADGRRIDFEPDQDGIVFDLTVIKEKLEVVLE